MPRWITMNKPFEHRWPNRSITVYAFKDLGEHFVKDELADAAIAAGSATEGKADGSTAKSVKSGPKKARARKAKTKATAAPPADKVDVDASASNIRSDSGLDVEVLDLHDRAEDGSGVDSGASER
jgi:hypothetical protein